MKAFKNFCLVVTLIFSYGMLDASTLITINDRSLTATESRAVSGFHSIHSAGSFDVYISFGQKEGIRLEGDAADLKDIETVVENGILKIRAKNNGKLRFSTSDVNVHITAKALRALNVAGSSDVKVAGLWKAADLSHAVSGSGSIEANIQANNYAASVTGSGEINVKGKAQNTRISVTGSGDFEGIELRTNMAKASVSGSGDISIHANEALDVSCSGSGDIRYRGAASVKSRIIGAGTIRKV